MQRLFIILLAAPLILGAYAPVLGQVQGKSGVLEADSTEIPGKGIYDVPPEAPDDAAEAVKEANPTPPLRIAPDFDANQLAPENAPVDIGPDFMIQGGALREDGVQPKASSDYRTFRNTNLNPPSTSTVDEPSLGVNGRAVFYTGNWFAGFSDDGGQSFDWLNPYDNFPADGTTDNPSNSGIFCCDQVVYYDRAHGIMIWFLQYRKSGEDPTQDSNIQRIAIADSQEDIINNNWYWYDFAPGDHGYNTTGQWFDFPDMAVTNDHLFFTTNVFNIVQNGNDTYNSSLVVRIPLDDLADGGGISYLYWDNLNTGTLRPVQGATTRMYLGTHRDNNTIRVFYNDSGSSTLYNQDVDHNGFQTGSHVTGCNDGNAYGKRSNSRILGAWRSGASGEIGFMWNAASGGSYPFPYVRIVRIDYSSWTVQQQRSIWNSNHAWLYPSVHVNDRGHLGGTITYGCGNVNWPNAAVWVIDDYNSPSFPSLDDFENYTFASSNDAPADSSWGDYLTTRRMVPEGNTWVGSGFRLDGGGGGGSVVPEFIWFGRERDMPPSSRNIYVDLNNTSGYETGSFSHPFNTVDEGEFALLPGDDLIIHGGTYVERVLFDTQSDVQSWSGTGNVLIKR